jgi:hypothetical protein
MKKFRRISTLALVLVLICALSVTSFAARRYSANEVETDRGNLICMEAELDQYTAMGQITVNGGQQMPYLYSSIQYTYNVSTIGRPPVTNTVTRSAYDARYARATVEITTNISAMHSAVYNYKADIPNESERYIGAPIILEY